MKKLVLTFILMSSISLLAACTANNNENLTDTTRINYSDRYDQNGTTNNKNDGYGNFIMNNQIEPDNVNEGDVNISPDPNPFDDNGNRQFRQLENQGRDRILDQNR
ncbi:hypothetical protein [Litchfieldia alkalitelluris]|uniref:hypothetical protein n=1 Tax=Litchfieldia alkalitelluris TaxID=304268 RepID=UPI00099805AB|nr:hypothetical protein [Litchfieldia alkalitelluris]